MASSHLDMTLYVIAPKFKDDSPSQSVTLKPGHGWAAGSWKVTLAFINRSKLRVTVFWDRKGSQAFIKFQSMRIIPRSNFLKVATTVMLDWKSQNLAWDESYSAEVTVPVANILEDDQYNFTIVFSTEADLLRSFFHSSLRGLASADSCSRAYTHAYVQGESAHRFANEGSRFGRCLLSLSPPIRCAPTSVSGLIVFLLSQHESLAHLIQEAKTLHSLGAIELAKDIADGDADVESDAETLDTFSDNSLYKAARPVTKVSPIDPASRAPLVIKVDAVSLATFCVMLQYIYTGEVDRAVDSTRFVLSDTNKASLVWRDSAGKVKDSVDWRPLGQDSPWRLKNVTWKELKDAAVHFGLTDLQVMAEQRLLFD
ncbi:MAG: hypothetical protein JOS17DRAFT_755025 [Linnemannia elongata]|nr:MAG: hypothetical protein JOS17DRAFT_755025 [Linnemannia elongata]